MCTVLPTFFATGFGSHAPVVVHMLCTRAERLSWSKACRQTPQIHPVIMLLVPTRQYCWLGVMCCCNCLAWAHPDYDGQLLSCMTYCRPIVQPCQSFEYHVFARTVTRSHHCQQY